MKHHNEFSENEAKEQFAKESMVNPLLKKFILRYGRLYSGRERPAGLRKRKAKHCFRIAEELSSKYDWEYAEGVYCPQPRLGWHEHAWCLDKGGAVVDAVCSSPKQAFYLGVVVPRAILSRSLLRTKMFGLFCRFDDCEEAIQDWIESCSRLVPPADLGEAKS